MYAWSFIRLFQLPVETRCCVRSLQNRWKLQNGGSSWVNYVSKAKTHRTSTTSLCPLGCVLLDSNIKKKKIEKRKLRRWNSDSVKVRLVYNHAERPDTMFTSGVRIFWECECRFMAGWELTCSCSCEGLNEPNWTVNASPKKVKPLNPRVFVTFDLLLAKRVGDVSKELLTDCSTKVRLFWFCAKTELSEVKTRWSANFMIPLFWKGWMQITEIRCKLGRLEKTEQKRTLFPNKQAGQMEKKLEEGQISTCRSRADLLWWMNDGTFVLMHRSYTACPSWNQPTFWNTDGKTRGAANEVSLHLESCWTPLKKDKFTS